MKQTPIPVTFVVAACFPIFAASVAAKQGSKPISQVHAPQHVSLLRGDLPSAIPEQPCLRGEERRTSSLCAEWKSADATMDAAVWTKIGVLFSGLAALGLIATVVYTRKALRLSINAATDADRSLAIAERNAQAALDHVRVAEQTAHRQLRPYAYVMGCNISFGHLETLNVLQDFAPFSLTVANFGRSPAKGANLKVTGIIEWLEGVPPKRLQIPVTDRYLADVPPGLSKEESKYFIIGLTDAHEDLMLEQAAIIIEGAVNYLDGVGNKYETKFRFISKGRDYADGQFKFDVSGNEAI